MKRVFEEWGGTIISVISVVTLIAFVVFMMSSTGVLSGSFQDVVRKFVGASGELIDSAASGFVQGGTSNDGGAGEGGEAVTGYKFGDAVDQGDYRYVYYGCESVDEFRNGYFRTALYEVLTNAPICLTEEDALEQLSPLLFGCTWTKAQENGYTALQLYEMLGGDMMYETFCQESRFADGWQVYAIDKTLAQYDDIPEKIDGIPVIWMNYTFEDCVNLVIAPQIPNSITTMASAFDGCTSLVAAPVIPSSVTILRFCFSNCSSLKTYHGSTDADGDFSHFVIPSGVTDMSHTFKNCALLTAAPVIPSNVSNLQVAFEGCAALTGTITINTNSITSSKAWNNDGECGRCFFGVDMTNITLVGDASKDVLNLIGSTGNNWTPIE